MYKLNVLRDERKGADLLLAESYIETVNRIDSITTATRFCVEYPEVSRALNYVDGSADDVAQAIFTLYRRHAQQVCSAIDAAGRAAISELRRGELPSTCLLRIAFAGSRKLTESVPIGEQETPVVEKATEKPQVVAVSSGSDGPGATVERSLVDGQWFADDPPKDGKFKFGPLEGPLKRLAEWMGMDHRTIKRLNGQTSWWVKRVHGKKFAVWFSTQDKYAAANQKRLAASQQKDTK